MGATGVGSPGLLWNQRRYPHEIFWTFSPRRCKWFRFNFMSVSENNHGRCTFSVISNFSTGTLTKHHDQAAFVLKGFLYYNTTARLVSKLLVRCFFVSRIAIQNGAFFIFNVSVTNLFEGFSFSVAHEQHSLLSIQIIPLVRCSIIAITKPPGTCVTVILIYYHVFLHHRLASFSETAVLIMVELWYKCICTVLVPDL